MRYSKQKEVVKDVVSRHRDHPSADDLYYEIREMIPNISLGTVYRNLERLISKGQLKKIDTDMLLRLVELARLSASASNLQPLKFLMLVQIR